MRFQFLIFGGMALIAGGCTVGPSYHPPRAKAASSFGELNSFVNTNNPVSDWWKEFHDPELSRFVEQALQSNYDLQIASVRIRESRLQRNITAADLFPTVDANGSDTHARGSKNVILPLGGSSSGDPASDPPSRSATRSSARRDDAMAQSVPDYGANPTATSPSPFGQGGLPGVGSDLYQVGFDASWEIDVFGGKRRQVQAATAQVQVSAASQRAMQVTLAAETARDYLQLRGAQEHLRIARENLAAQQDVLTLTRSMSKSGLASDLDVVRAVAEVEETESVIPPLEAQSRQWMHALAVLIAREPNDLSAELTVARPIPSAPPEVPVGLPSALVQRRADIQQVEREMAASTARIGAAQADLFPKFALIGTAGLDSSSPANLFNWESRYFLISPTAAWRIFDAGRIMSNIKLQKASAQEAELQYRQTVLKALQEVEDALVAYASEHARHDHLARQFATSQQELDLAQERYKQGLSDFLSVLDAQRTVFSAQDSLAQSDVLISTDLVALYKSLGGGWR